MSASSTCRYTRRTWLGIQYYCIQRQMEMEGQRQLTSLTQTPWRPGRNLPPPKVLMGRRARIVSGGSSALIPRPRSTGSLQMAINQCTNHTGLIAVSYRFRHSTLRQYYLGAAQLDPARTWSPPADDAESAVPWQPFIFSSHSHNSPLFISSLCRQ
jgi:hypothetical protein